MTNSFDIEEQARGWFARLRDEDAPASAWIDFQDWLEAADGHRLAYDDVEALWLDLDAASYVELAANEDGPRFAASRPRTSRRPGWAFPTIAAAAAAALTVGVWSQLDTIRPAEVYRTDSEARDVTLSDGSRVSLNRHSVMSVRITKSDRKVTLDDGEAAFDVRHDETKPFVISSGDHSVRVLGTAFNVLAHGDRFSVAVQRGIVAVTPARSDQAFHLVAGQRIDQNGVRQAVLSKEAPERASEWRQGVLVYRDKPIADVADDLSRYLNKPVTVSSSAQPLHFTGALQVGDEARMLKQLQDFVPVQAARSSTEVRLTARESR